MSEVQEEVVVEEETGVDIAALEAHLEGIVNEEVVVEEEVIEDEVVEDAVIEPFDIDAAINSGEHVNLTSKITQDEADVAAKSRGWNEDGSDKYGHKISSYEFLERASFFKKNDLIRGDMEKVKEQLGKVLEQNQQIAQKSIEKQKQMKADFEAEKEKLLSGDFLDETGIARIKEIDSGIAENTTVTEADPAEALNLAYDKSLKVFKENNAWYDDNENMTDVADAIGKKYATKYRDANNGELPDPSDLFNHVEAEVKKRFPDKPEVVRPNKVTSGNRVVTQTNKPKKKTLADLPEEARSLAKEVMEATGLSEGDYLSTYKF